VCFRSNRFDFNFLKKEAINQIKGQEDFIIDSSLTYVHSFGNLTLEFIKEQIKNSKLVCSSLGCPDPELCTMCEIVVSQAHRMIDESGNEILRRFLMEPLRPRAKETFKYLISLLDAQEICRSVGICESIKDKSFWIEKLADEIVKEIKF
jgi:hypothetical protein